MRLRRIPFLPLASARGLLGEKVSPIQDVTLTAPAWPVIAGPADASRQPIGLVA